MRNPWATNLISTTYRWPLEILLYKRPTDVQGMSNVPWRAILSFPGEGCEFHPWPGINSFTATARKSESCGFHSAAAVDNRPKLVLNSSINLNEPRRKTGVSTAFQTQPTLAFVLLPRYAIRYNESTELTFLSA